MLWSLIDFYYFLQGISHSYITISFKPLLSVWSSIWIEWFTIQSLILYSLYRVYTSSNYLRQVLAIMWVVILLCLYLSLWQLELFACFLFLGEFTILIFFYCLLLHLKASVSQNTSSRSNIGGQYTIITALLVFTLWLGTRSFLLDYEENSIAYALDLYKVYLDFVLNDLVALYYYFTASNPSIHVLIGVILFVLTLFLFVTVAFYTTAVIAKKASFKTASNKLFTPRGYYEQSAEYSQKYFNQSFDNK